MYELLQTLCEQCGMTVTNLCVQVTGSKGNLATWKKGYMRSDYLAKCADILECSTDYLLGRTTIKEINMPTPSNTQFLALNEPLIRPMVGIAAAGKPLTMTVGCYDMIKIDAVSDVHKKISPQDFTVEIHGDSMIDAGIYNGDYAVIHPCPMVENGEIALVAVGDDCTLKKFYRTDSGIELHPCNPKHNIQKYKLSDEIRIIGIFVCACKGEIIEQY